MTMTKQSPNSTALTLGILLILSSFGYMYFLGVPALKAAKQDKEMKTAQHEAKQAEITQLQSAQSKLTQKEQELTSAGISPAALQSILPLSEEVPSLYLQMETIVKQATTLSNITYQIGKPIQDPIDGIAKVPLTISANGSYANLKNFLKTLENNTRPASLTSITLNQSGDPTKPQDSKLMSLSASGYFSAQTISAAYTTPQ